MMAVTLTNSAMHFDRLCFKLAYSFGKNAWNRVENVMSRLLVGWNLTGIEQTIK